MGLLDIFRRKPPASQVRIMRGRKINAAWDAGETGPTNERHWARADALSADAAASASVRKTLRERARYETKNNPYLYGQVHTLANDTIGTGPRLQALLPEDLYPGVNTVLESAWRSWAKKINLAEKLRTMRIAKCVDGEAFALKVRNTRLPDVQLDIRLIEADQVSHDVASYSAGNANAVDGIELDEAHNPVAYHVLKAHPGGMTFRTASGEDVVPADEVIHYFTPDRPGQHRGVPEIASSLPLWPILRRYTLASLIAAETAANIAILLETENPSDDAEPPDPWETMDLERGAMMTLPSGAKASGFKSEPPATPYGEFKREIITEGARPLGMPRCIAGGDSSAYNYASGRLDFQAYYKTIRVERSKIERDIIDDLAADFLEEARLLPALALPPDITIDALPHRWFWDGNEHVDPVKEANATETDLRNCVTTLAEVCADKGQDWEDVIAQIARERRALAALPPAPQNSAPKPAAPAEDDEDLSPAGRSKSNE